MNQYKKQFLLMVGVGLLTITMACGGGSSNGGGFGGGGGGNGTFTKASLSGQYAYQLSGFDLQTGNPFREAGVFTADGNGHITSGTDDSASGGTPASGAVTGTYSISSDGTGQMTLTFPNTAQASFAITLASSSKVYIIEADNTGIVVSGVASKQDTSAFSATPGGTFVFRMHEIAVGLGGVTSSIGQVGVFTVNSGNIAAGSVDSNRNLVVSSSAITGGSLNSPDANTGRGTGTFTDGTNTTAFNYYVVDASHILLFSVTNGGGVVGLGQAEKQSGTFSKSTLSGSYAFGSVGDAANLVNDTNTAGRFTADGNGSVSNGTLDQVEDGVATSVASPTTFAGFYTMVSSGRADVMLTTTTIGTIHYILWMVSPSRAFLLTDSASEVEDGTVDLQTGTFSNSSLNGTYAFNLTGFDGTSSLVTNDFVGTLKMDGAGAVTSRIVLNVNGTANQPPTATGTYTTSSNGRAVASINGISNNLVFYMISPTDAYVIQNDPNVELHGAMSKQP